MSLGSALIRGRRRAEKLMLDTAFVTRIRHDASGLPVETTVEGVVTPVRDTVYTGKAKRQSFQSYEQKPNAGEHTYTIQRYSAHFPIGAFEPKVGDVIEWTACPMDPDRVGAHDRITALFSKTLATAQRVFVEQEVA